MKTIHFTGSPQTPSLEAGERVGIRDGLGVFGATNKNGLNVGLLVVGLLVGLLEGLLVGLLVVGLLVGMLEGFLVDWVFAFS